MSGLLVFEKSQKGRRGYTYPPSDVPCAPQLSAKLCRQEPPQLPELSELDVVRHYSNLAKITFGVDFGPYPLGSCTMKYNPKLHNLIARMEGFFTIHPLQDSDSVQGALSVMFHLLEMLAVVTGMDWGTLQPAAGAHGEYTGLKIIRSYHLSKGDSTRTKVLIPSTAHGTNPASAALNGFNVVEIPTDKRGLVDLSSLESLLDETVAAVMLTNPNTLGFFERDITRIATLVHESGGLLYYDGANLNAILGMVRPGDMGFDVVHLNLHKTFSTPHGGGGPGAGPVMVKSLLRPFLPKPDMVKDDSGYNFDWGSQSSIGKVSGFWGNFLVLVRAYAYLLSMGSDGLRSVAHHAVLNANYCLERLKKEFTHPFGGHCMHEFVLSLQDFKDLYGVGALDFCKALLDRGYHPPTMYFPLLVHEALMIEPTETESIQDLDALVETLLELAQIAKTAPDQLTNAPISTVIRRVDEVRAVKRPILRWRPSGDS